MRVRFYKKAILLISSLVMLAGFIFLPAPVFANHDSCGNPGMSGGPERYNRCITDTRQSTNERCFNNNAGNNDAIASCVAQADTHFAYSGPPINAPPLPGDALPATVGSGAGRTRTPVESCHSGGFFGFPTWFKYLRGEEQQNDSFDSRIGKTCEPVIGGIKDVLLIGAAILEILLRIAVFLAIGLVVWGAIQFIIGQGEPDRVSAARSTIVNAVIGLVVVVVASAVISFIAGRFVAS